MIIIQPLRFLLLASILGLAACSGSSSEDNVSEISVSALTAEVVADGSSSTTINAVVKDDKGGLLPDVKVTFQTNLGGFNNTSEKSVTVNSNSSGIASASISSSTPGTATTSVIAGSASASTTITFTTNTNDQIAHFSLNASQSEVMVGTTQTVLLTGTVTDASGDPLAGVNVSFSADGGKLTKTSGVTDDNGVVTVGLNGTAGMTAGVVKVTADASGFLASSTVTYREDISAQVVSVKLGVSQSSTLADGSNIILSAQAYDVDGIALAGVEIKFNSTLGTLAADTVLTRDDGTSDRKLATTTIKSFQAGQAQIKASVGDIEASQTIDFTASAVEPITPATMSLSASKISVTSNNASKSKITATLLDSNNAVLAGAVVRFQASGGQLSLSKVVSDENGEASVLFSSGTIDPSNRIATVTAVTGSLEKQIPIQVIGSVVEIESESNMLVLGTSVATDATKVLNILAKNSNNDPIYDTDLTVSIDSSSSGSATLSVSSGKSDIEGKLQTTLTATSAGTVKVNVSGLGTSNSASFVINQVEQAFQITTPTDSRVNANIGDPVTIIVKAPNSANVKFATSMGTLTGTSTTAVNISEAVTSGTAQAILNTTTGGAATVEVFDAVDKTIIDRVVVDFSSAPTSATHISVQADRTIVPLKVGDINYQAKVIARVFDDANMPVSNATVWFSIENSTGGGEWVSPIYGITKADGSIETTFTSGTISSDQSGVSIKAVLDNGTTQFSDNVSIVVGGTAGSLVVGRGTSIASINSDTAYDQPLSVLVADSNGNPIAGNSVSISAWPVGFYKGYWQKVYSADGTLQGCEARFTSSRIANEDINENLILDAAEDSNADGYLTPGNSAAGSLPQILMTDENGLATFSLTYLKHYSTWLDVRIRASTLVQGTETTSSLIYKLASLGSDVQGCALPSSPFGIDTFSVTSSTYSIVVGSTSIITATGGTGPYNFTIDNPGVATIVSLTDNTATLTATAPGIVNVVAVDKNNVFGYVQPINIKAAP